MATYHHGRPQREPYVPEHRSEAELKADLVRSTRMAPHRICAVLGILLGVGAAVALFAPVGFASAQVRGDRDDHPGFDDYTYACGSVLSPAATVGERRIEFSDECSAYRTRRAGYAGLALAAAVTSVGAGALLRGSGRAAAPGTARA
ncbi:hypothetical protein ABT381_27365 [Streptomyces sp. NPDC000151]|uniref:hypothetical protein n=1 Tax=Streptomyces sp. NPDC000151 TaxID=3154244 RepID=UPI00332C5A10